MNKLLLASITLIITLPSCTHRQSELKIYLADSSRDTITPDETANIPAKFINTGDDTLIIEDFQVSCNCTTPCIKKGQKLLPNSTLVSDFSIKADSADIRQNKTVYFTVKTNLKPQLLSIEIPYYVK